MRIPLRAHAAACASFLARNRFWPATVMNRKTRTATGKSVVSGLATSRGLVHGLEYESLCFPPFDPENIRVICNIDEAARGGISVTVGGGGGEGFVSPPHKMRSYRCLSCAFVRTLARDARRVVLSMNDASADGRREKTVSNCFKKEELVGRFRTRHGQTTQLTSPMTHIAAHTGREARAGWEGTVGRDSTIPLRMLNI